MAAPQTPDHFEPIELGQPQIEYEQNEDVVFQGFVGRSAVGYPIDDVTRLRQRELQCFGENRVVLRNQYSQSSSSAKQINVLFPNGFQAYGTRPAMDVAPLPWYGAFYSPIQDFVSILI